MANPELLSWVLSVKDQTVNWRGFRALPWNLPQHLPGMYRFINLNNGKPYIGIGQDLWVRLDTHSRGSSTRKLKLSIRKYGKSNFIIEPLFYSIDGTDGLEWIETISILDHDAIKNGYNVQAASYGCGPYGEAFASMRREIMTRPENRSLARQRMIQNQKDPTFREKSLAATKAAWSDPQARATRLQKIKETKAIPEIALKIRATHESEAFRTSARERSNRYWSDDTARQRAREETNRRYSDPEERRIQSERMTAVLADPSLRTIISKKSKAYWGSEEGRKRSQARSRAYWDSPGARERGAEESRRRYQSEAARQKLRESSLAAWSSEEKRNEHSEKLKRYWATPEGKAAKREQVTRGQETRRKNAAAKAQKEILAVLSAAHVDVDLPAVEPRLCDPSAVD